MRYILEHQKETSGSAGAWNSFAIIKRDVRSPAGVGTASKIRCRFILDDRNSVSGTDGVNLPSQNMGTFWAACYQNSTQTVDGEGGQLDPDNIIAIKAAGHFGNVVLDLENAKLRQDGFDGVECDGDIYLWMKNSDATENDTLVWRIFIELDGRWVRVDPL